jgi:hypothetical protein
MGGPVRQHADYGLCLSEVLTDCLLCHTEEMLSLEIYLFKNVWRLNFPSNFINLNISILYSLPRYSSGRLFDFASKLIKKQQFKSKFF